MTVQENSTRKGSRIAREPTGYRLVHRDPKLARVVQILKATSHKRAYICRKSGVTPTTLTNWVSGKTRRPQHITMEYVLRACGYTFDIVPRQ